LSSFSLTGATAGSTFSTGFSIIFFSGSAVLLSLTSTTFLAGFFFSAASFFFSVLLFFFGLVFWFRLSRSILSRIFKPAFSSISSF